MKTCEGNYKVMSTYNGTRSSIMYLIKLDYVYPSGIKEKICNLMKGFCITIEQQKVHSQSLNEGKDPLSFCGYHLL